MPKNTAFYTKQTLRLGDQLYPLRPPLIMGILNVTPDSFYQSSKASQPTSQAAAQPSPEEALEQAVKLVAEGADILDIGGMSSRPGATLISEQEELDRVMPAVELIRNNLPEVPLSIDTVRSGVVRSASAAGVHLINDISAGSLDPALIQEVARSGLAYVLMHMQGKPETMQDEPAYKDVVMEVFDFFTEKLAMLREAGITEIILDPGFGFGKELTHNYSLLNRLADFQALGLPILAGISRKSMINRALGIKPEQALNGTTALHAVALQNGASILRVHDPQEAREVVRLFEHLQQD